MDVVRVVTPLVRGGAQVLYGDQVVELRGAARSAGEGRKRTGR